MLMKRKKVDGSGVTVRLREIPHSKVITIGRGKEATVVIDDPKASRIHTSIWYWDDIFVIRDMGSSNGTVLNGEKVDVAKLKPGDVVQIGDTELHMESEATRTDVTMAG